MPALSSMLKPLLASIRSLGNNSSTIHSSLCLGDERNNSLWGNSNKELYSVMLFIIASGLCSIGFKPVGLSMKTSKYSIMITQLFKFLLNHIGTVNSSSSRAGHLKTGFSLRYITPIHALKLMTQ